MDHLEEYIKYHTNSSRLRDIDPANDCLRYISERFELNIEQRYWLAFLYSCCYSPATTYYIYNEFPDFENVNVNRLQRWWDANRDNLIFQTDRLRVKSSNQFVEAFKSYKLAISELSRSGSQEDAFYQLTRNDSDTNYKDVWKFGSQIYTFGRFTLFIYLEMLHVLTDLDIIPDTLDLANAESCRNGLALAYGLNHLNNHKSKKKMLKEDIEYLQTLFVDLMRIIGNLDIQHKSIWNVETTLCAYKKYRLGKRYVGYYIERSGKEIYTMQSRIKAGVDWSPLWQFREETYQHQLLSEKNLKR